MKVLFISPEVGPIVRAGGLGDVVGALQIALKEIGIDVRIICPLHRECKTVDATRLKTSINLRFGTKSYNLKVKQTELGDSGIPVYLLENKFLFDRPGIYADENGNYTDNPIRCFVLAKSAIQLKKIINWSADIYHCHDWMTGALPAYLNVENRKNKSNSKSVLTIHNLEHQGSFSEENFDLSKLPKTFFGWDGFNHYGAMNLLKGGIQHADKITTVSPTYADEIRTEQYGESLEKSLEYRGGDLIGILNGIDINSWNPKDDSALEHPIYQNSPEKGKFANKVELLKQMKLPLENNIPLLGVVSRLFHQKGLDMLAECLPQLTNDQKFQLIVLGSGEKALEDSFLNLAKRYSNKISIQIGFDDKLARRIFAGSDFFIMPSRFEPCGLAQQYAMRYGSIPVARKTGGLADTIIDLEKDQRHGNGLLFQEPSPDCLRQVINRAIELFQNPEKFKSIRKNAINSYFSWDLAAKKYENVYQWALQS